MFVQWFWIICWLKSFRSSHSVTKSYSTSLYVWERTGSFKDESCTIGYMFHSYAKTEGLIIELSFSKVLNYMSIGTFQKEAFWRQRFVLLWGVIGTLEEEIFTVQYAPQLSWNWKTYNTISKTMFVQLDMFHSYTKIGGFVIELAFSMVLNYMLIGTSQKQPFWHRSSMRSHRYFGRGSLCSAIRSTVKLKLKELK